MSAKTIPNMLLCLSLGFTATEAFSAQVVQVPIAGLARYDAKSIQSLLNDVDVRGPVNTLIPSSEQGCWHQALKSFPPLRKNTQGGLTTALNGTETHQLKRAFFSVDPSGEINIVLQCRESGSTGKEFVFFSTADPKMPPSQELIDWFWVVEAKRGSVIRRSRNYSEVYIIPKTARPKPVDTYSAPSKFVFDTTSRKQVLGLWRCRVDGDMKPDLESLFFNKQGDFVSLSPKGRYQGVFKFQANQIRATVPDSSNKAKKRIQEIILSPRKVSASEIQLELRQYDTTRSLECLRDPKYKL